MRHQRRIVSSVLVVGFTLLAMGLTPHGKAQLQPSFEAVHIVLDVDQTPLAAYQIEFGSAPGSMTVVGVEGGSHVQFAEPPYYDERAIQRERVVIGAFSTAAADQLPSGRVRVATIHVLINDPKVSFSSKLQAVATVGGGSINARVILERGSHS